ncbi:MAG: helix-turn-helix domain-containing protein [Opitutales bacterium]
MVLNKDPKGFFRYLPLAQYDKITGFFVTNFGWTEIEPGMPYPPWQHPTEFSFTSDSGRRIDEYQLVYITRGSGTFWSAKTGTLPVRAGTVFLLYPGVGHRYSPDTTTGWNEQWFGFNGEVAERIMAHYFEEEPPVLELGIKPELLSLFDEIRALMEEQSAGYRRIMALNAHEILVRLQIATQTDQASDVEIEAACRYIEEHYNEAIDFDAYAKSNGRSYSNFRRRFKDYTGSGLNQYQLSIKLQNAKRLLDNSNLNIKAISQECGFESPYYFSRFFKSKTGYSPKQYRLRW